MPFARIQEKEQQNSSATSHNVVMDVAPTNGNLIVAVCRCQGVVDTTMLDGTNWTRVNGATITVGTNHCLITLWKRAGPGESATQTPLTSAIGVTTNVYAIEASGEVATGDPLNQANEAQAAASGNSQQPGSITPTTDGCLLVVGSGQGSNNGGNEAINSGFTRWPDGSSVFIVGFLIQSAAAAINPTLSWTTNVNNRTAVIAAFQPEAGAAATKPRRPLVRSQAMQRSYRWMRRRDGLLVPGAA